MTTIVGRNVKIEVALTFASPVSPTAVTKANPAVGTLTSHTLSDNDVAYWTISAGMVEMDGQAVHIMDTSANTFTMNGLDTSNYSTYSAGTLTPASTWGTISEAASYSVGGGAANALDDTRLIDVKTRNVAGLLAPQDITVDVRNGVSAGTAMAFVEAAARNSTSCLFRISQGSTVLRVYYGVPSVPGESVSAGGLATGQFNILGAGWAVKPNL